MLAEMATSELNAGRRESDGKTGLGSQQLNHYRYRVRLVPPERSPGPGSRFGDYLANSRASKEGMLTAGNLLDPVAAAIILGAAGQILLRI